MKSYLRLRIFYGLIAALLLYIIIAQCILTYSEGRSLANTFSYFTIQSNVFVLVSATILAIRPTITGWLWRIFRLATLVGITVTGLVYIFLLAPYVHLTGMASVYNHVFHYIMPIASVLGFFFIDKKYGFKWRDYWFMAWPVLWLVYTFVRAAVSDPKFTGFAPLPSRYPYNFLDVTKVPMSEVVGSIIFVTGLLLAIGAAYIALDKHKRTSSLAQPNNV